LTGQREEYEHDMSTRTEDMRETCKRLVKQESDARAALQKAQEDIESVREADVQAFAEAAIAGSEAPKRKEVTLRHKIDNLGIALQGYEAAFQALLEDATTACGEGRRELNEHEQRLLRDLIIPKLTEEQRREAWQRGELVAAEEATPRPDDLIEFVTEAYDKMDARHEANEEARRRKEGYREAIAAIQRAKTRHGELGRDMRDFSTSLYEDIVTPELQQYLGRTPGRGVFQNQTQGNEVPWPGSLQDLEANSEPASTPA
jgi:hypothetical protein